MLLNSRCAVRGNGEGEAPCAQPGCDFTLNLQLVEPAGVKRGHPEVGHIRSPRTQLLIFLS